MTLATNPEWLKTPPVVHVFWLPQVSLELVWLTPMPAPSLVGLPVDDAGYQALYRGYTSQIVTAVVVELLGADCCRNAVLFQAALADQLAQLGLQPWPLTRQDYEQFLLNPQGWLELRRYWEEERPFSTPSDDWAAYALVDYVVHELGLLTITEFQKSLVEFNERPYTDWIQHIMQPLQSNLWPQQAWLSFVYDQTESARTAPPVPLPNQALYLLCADKQASWSLVRYDVQADIFTYLSRSVTGPAFLLGLPDDVGVIVGEQLTSPTTSDLFLWANGQKIAISWPRTAETPGALPVMPDPTGRRILLSGRPENSPFGVFPVAACLAGESCNIEVADGFPVWSPDGSQVIVAAGYESLEDMRLESTLFYGDENGGIPDLSPDTVPLGTMVGTGAATFWLDNGRFGYVQYDVNEGQSAVYLGNEAGDDPISLFTAEDLAAALPAGDQGVQTRIDNVMVHPTSPDQLLVAVANSLPQQGAAHLFVYNLVDESVAHRFSFQAEPTVFYRGYRFSPNGRYLAITSLTRDQSAFVLYIHDLQAGTTQLIELDEQYFLPPYLYLDWSADGRWLTMMQDGYVRLIELNSGYERWAISPVLGCSAAAWVNENE